MCGSATLTMVASSTTISCAAARTTNASPVPGCGPPAPHRPVQPPAWLGILFRA
jgi:hypothetical protein